MILGIGTDIVNIGRIEKLIQRFGERFLTRIFTQNEREAASLKSIQKTAYLAKRFAAKEAFSKALGTGFRHGLRFQQIEVVNDKNGKPMIQLYDYAKKILDQKTDHYEIHLSLSDDIPYAQAFVVIESHL